MIASPDLYLKRFESVERKAERLWFHHQRSPENTSYNLPLILQVVGNLVVLALEQSLSEIVAPRSVSATLRALLGPTSCVTSAMRWGT